MGIASRVRRDAILKGLDVTRMRGVEIGPLDRPLISKNESEVYYLDHCTTENLKIKYARDPNVETDNIVNVDFIWADEPVSRSLSNICPLDYVVASHVIEHVPDLIGWLHEMHEALREGGLLILAIPDKRFTFDVYRRTSAMEEIRLAHAERRRRPGLRCVMDHFANVVRADARTLWNDYSKVGELLFFHDPSILGVAATHYAAGSYVDVHCWVFTPWSFLETLGQIVSETGLGFDLQSFQTTPFHSIEFYVRLARVTQSTTDWKREAAAARANALWPEKLGRAVELADSEGGAQIASRISELESMNARLVETINRLMKGCFETSLWS